MNEYGVRTEGSSGETVACPERIQELRSAHCRISNRRYRSSRRLPAPVLHGGRFGFFRGLGREAISPIFGDCPIDDCSAVDAFPGIEGQKKVRESFQHHQSFALRAIHNFLPC